MVEASHDRTSAVRIDYSRSALFDSPNRVLGLLKQDERGLSLATSLPEGISISLFDGASREGYIARILTEGWCSFNVCLRGHFISNVDGREEWCRPEQIGFTRSVGSELRVVPPGLRLTNVAVSGPKSALAAYCGMSAAGLDEILGMFPQRRHYLSSSLAQRQAILKSASNVVQRLGALQGSPLEALRLKSRVLDFLLRCMDRLGQVPAEDEVHETGMRPVDRRIFEVASYLSSPENSHVSLAEIASAFGFSRTSLCEKFQAHFQMSIGEFRARRMLELAAQRIDEGESLTSLSFMLGFSSPSNFSRAFRRVYGLSPQEYRRNRRYESG